MVSQGRLVSHLPRNIVDSGQGLVGRADRLKSGGRDR